jgi:hypothetical protein
MSLFATLFFHTIGIILLSIIFLCPFLIGLMVMYGMWCDYRDEVDRQQQVKREVEAYEKLENELNNLNTKKK